MDLYHYTDLNAVHSILSTHKIRMTDIRFLNDKTEYLQGINILRDAAADIFSGDEDYYPGFVEAATEWSSKNGVLLPSVKCIICCSIKNGDGDGRTAERV